MTIHESLMKTIQDDARRAGERNRLLLEVQQARRASRQRPVPPGAGDTFFTVSYRAILVRLDCRAWLSVRRPGGYLRFLALRDRPGGGGE
jgi:hypothetical protein